MSVRVYASLVLVCLAVCGRGQKFDLFAIENEELVWRCTYEYDGPHDSLRREVVSMLKSKVFTQHVVRNELGYNGEIRHYQVDCRRYGRKYNNTPLIYWSGEWKGKFIVEMAERGYRVTIYGLYVETPQQQVSRTQSKPPRKGFYKYEVWKRGQPNFRKNKLDDMVLMSMGLRDAFDISQYVSKDF